MIHAMLAGAIAATTILGMPTSTVLAKENPCGWEKQKPKEDGKQEHKKEEDPQKLGVTFYIRIDNVEQEENGTTHYDSSHYVGGMSGTLLEKKQINKTSGENYLELIENNIQSQPSIEEFVINGKTYSSEKYDIIWYVIKLEEDSWHVDGIIHEIGTPVPEDPSQPIIIPEDPEDPENPDNPDNPENPDNPDNPENPENPENPDNPDNPDNPEDPEDPEDPENPEDPEDPDDPDDPEDPENPEDPEDPDDPDDSEDPDDPDTSEDPEDPDDSNNPDASKEPEDSPTDVNNTVTVDTDIDVKVDVTVPDVKVDVKVETPVTPATPVTPQISDAPAVLILGEKPPKEQVLGASQNLTPTVKGVTTTVGTVQKSNVPKTGDTTPWKAAESILGMAGLALLQVFKKMK